jgi:hypothetical protein
MAGRGGIGAALGSIGSLIGAATCCIPLGTVLAAAGTAGVSAALDTARSWLMPLSVALIAVALWQTYRVKPESGRRPLAGQVVLWGAAAMVVVLLLFPQQVALLVAGSRGSPAGQPELLFLNEQNIQSFEEQFNQTSGDVRVLLMLSPS